MVRKYVSEVNELQQYTRSDNLEISGVSEMKAEQISTLLDNVAKCIGVHTEPGNIVIAHRVPTRSTKLPKTILVLLQSRLERGKWIEVVRKRRNVTCSNMSMNI